MKGKKQTKQEQNIKSSDYQIQSQSSFRKIPFNQGLRVQGHQFSSSAMFDQQPSNQDVLSRRTSTQSKSGVMSSKGRPFTQQENLLNYYSRDPSHINIQEGLSDKDLEYGKNQKKPRVKTAVKKSFKQKKMIGENERVKPIMSNQNTINNQRQELAQYLSRVTSQNDSKRQEMKNKSQLDNIIMDDYQQIINQKNSTNIGSTQKDERSRDGSSKGERRSVKIMRHGKPTFISSNEDNTPIGQDNLLKPKQSFDQLSTNFLNTQNLSPHSQGSRTSQGSSGIVKTVFQQVDKAKLPPKRLNLQNLDKGHHTRSRTAVMISPTENLRKSFVNFQKSPQNQDLINQISNSPVGFDVQEYEQRKRQQLIQQIKKDFKVIKMQKQIGKHRPFSSQMVDDNQKIGGQNAKYEWVSQNEKESLEQGPQGTDNEFSFLDQFFLKPYSKASRAFESEEFDPEAVAKERRRKKLVKQFEKNQARFSQIMDKDEQIKFQKFNTQYDSRYFDMSGLMSNMSSQYLTSQNQVIFQSGENELKQQVAESTDFINTLNDTNSESLKKGRNSAFLRTKAGSNQLNPLISQDLRSKNDTVFSSKSNAQLSSQNNFQNKSRSFLSQTDYVGQGNFVATSVVKRVLENKIVDMMQDFEQPPRSQTTNITPNNRDTVGNLRMMSSQDYLNQASNINSSQNLMVADKMNIMSNDSFDRQAICKKLQHHTSMANIQQTPIGLSNLQPHDGSNIEFDRFKSRPMTTQGKMISRAQRVQNSRSALRSRHSKVSKGDESKSTNTQFYNTFIEPAGKAQIQQKSRILRLQYIQNCLNNKQGISQEDLEIELEQKQRQMEQKVETQQRFKRILKNPKQKNLEEYLRQFQRPSAYTGRPCSSIRPSKKDQKAATQKNKLMTSSITIVNEPLTSSPFVNANMPPDRTMKYQHTQEDMDNFGNYLNNFQRSNPNMLQPGQASHKDRRNSQASRLSKFPSERDDPSLIPTQKVIKHQKRARTRKQSKEKVVKPLVPPLDLYFDKKIFKNQKHKVFDHIFRSNKDQDGYNTVLKNELIREKNYNMMQLYNNPLIKEKVSQVKAKISELKYVPPLDQEADDEEKESLNFADQLQLKEEQRLQEIEKKRKLKIYGRYEKELDKLGKGSEVYKNNLRKTRIMKQKRRVYAKVKEGIITKVITTVVAHKIKDEMKIQAAQIMENALKELTNQGEEGCEQQDKQSMFSSFLTKAMPSKKDIFVKNFTDIKKPSLKDLLKSPTSSQNTEGPLTIRHGISAQINEAFVDEDFKRQLRENELKYQTVLKKMERYQKYIEKKIEVKPKIEKKIVNKRAMLAGLDTFDDILAGRITAPGDVDPQKLHQYLAKKKALRMKEKANRRATLKGKFREAVAIAARMYSKIGMPQKMAFNWKANLHRFIIQKYGIEIKKMVYDLENNVCVNQEDLHDNFKMLDRTIKIDNNPVLIPKQSNYVSLIRGHAQFFIMEYDVRRMIEDRSQAFPLRMKIFNNKLINFLIAKNVSESRIENPIKLRKHLKKIQKEFDEETTQLFKQLKELIICISRTNRMPTMDNCDKYYDGINALEFMFGGKKLGEEIFDEARKTKQFKQKLYFSIQYGYIENFNECDGSEDDSDHQDQDVEINSLEFYLLIKFTAKMTQEQIQLARQEQERRKLDLHQAFVGLRKKFKKTIDQMGDFEKERFEKMQMGIIKTELRKAYINYYNEVQSKADFVKQKTMKIKKQMCSHLLHAVQGKLGLLMGPHSHSHSHSHHDHENQEEQAHGHQEEKSHGHGHGGHAHGEPYPQTQESLFSGNLSSLLEKDILSDAHPHQATETDVKGEQTLKHQKLLFINVKTNEVKDCCDDHQVMSSEKICVQSKSDSNQFLDVFQQVRTARVLQEELSEETATVYDSDKDDKFGPECLTTFIKANKANLVVPKQPTLNQKRNFIKAFGIEPTLNEVAGQIKSTQQQNIQSLERKIKRYMKKQALSPDRQRKKQNPKINVLQESGIEYEIPYYLQDDEDHLKIADDDGQIKLTESDYSSESSYSSFDSNRSVKKAKVELTKMRFINNQIRKYKIDKLLKEAKKKAEIYGDPQQIAQMKKEKQTEAFRQKSIKSFNRWDDYKQSRFDMQNKYISIIHKSAGGRETLTLQKLRQILGHLKENFEELQRRKALKFLMMSVAMKAKVKFKMVYMRIYGRSFKQRHQQLIQRSLTLTAGLNYINECFKERAMKCLKFIFEKAIREMQIDDMIMKLKVFYGHIKYIQQTMRDRPKFLAAKSDMMRHSFKTEFDRLFQFYQYKALKEKKSQDKFKNIFEKFSEFKRVYFKAEIKFLQNDLFSDASSSSDSDSSSQKSGRSKSSNTSSAKQTQSFLDRQKKREVKKQQAKEEKARIMQFNTDECKRIYLAAIEDFINMKSLIYCVKYMLYRNSKYQWLIVGGRRQHPKLGDLLERQNDIKISLPQFKEKFEEFSQSLFGESEQILLDSEDISKFGSNEQKDDAISEVVTSTKFKKKKSKSPGGGQAKRREKEEEEQKKRDQQILQKSELSRQGTIFLSAMDGVINSTVREREKRKQDSEFKPFLFAPTIEEKQRLVYKCVMVYNSSMIKFKQGKKRKAQKKAKKRDKSNSDSKSILSKGEKEEIAGLGILSQDLIGVVIEEEEQKEADLPRGRSRGRQQYQSDKLELIQTQTEKKREANKSR